MQNDFLFMSFYVSYIAVSLSKDGKWLQTTNRRNKKKKIEKKINSFRLRGCSSCIQSKKEFIGSDNWCAYEYMCVNKHIEHRRDKNMSQSIDCVFLFRTNYLV